VSQTPETKNPRPIAGDQVNLWGFENPEGLNTFSNPRGQKKTSGVFGLNHPHTALHKLGEAHDRNPAELSKILPLRSNLVVIQK
jgi:hypothetical protein